MARRVIGRWRDRATSALERFLLQGPLARLAFIACLLLLLSLGAGLLAWEVAGPFDSPWSAIWWAFLRLSDPGYLGDDVGAPRRVIGTALIVFGYVLFLGALVAIMTQWLNATIARLQLGLTPIARNGHVVILGWSSLTAIIVRELLWSEERVERFLLLGGARRLHVAILADEVTPAHRQELRDRLGEDWDERLFTFRSGTPLRQDHLRRVDILHAGAVILPAPPVRDGTTLSADGHVLKALLAVDAAARAERMAPPPMVAEIQDARKAPLARRVYGGPLELLANDLMISRLVAQVVRHPGLSAVYRELLSEEQGNEVRVREAVGLEGLTFAGARERFPSAVLLGVVRQRAGHDVPHLNPPDDFALAAGDRCVVLSGTERDSLPSDAAPSDPAPPLPAAPVAPAAPPSERRLLLLGWNRKIPALVREFDSYQAEPVALDILARIDAEAQHRHLRAEDALPKRIRLRHIEGEKTSLADVGRLDLAGYDTVVILASDWLESPEEADARTLLAYFVVRELLPREGGGPRVVIEVLEEENAALVPLRPGDELLESPLMTSYGLTQVTLRRELRVVFDELFGPRGPEIVFRPLAACGLAPGRYGFAAVSRALAARGDLAIGIRRAEPAGGFAIELNPGRTVPLELGPADAVVVLAR
ncbi:MAG TPA: hypothetical protein VLA95_02370 [Gemmatimonadales bacterium]|nr:hypothetical protein [Gemmatimonadales bacterium]